MTPTIEPVTEADDLRFPIGKFEGGLTTNRDDREIWTLQIATAPSLLRAAVEGLNETQLETPYRNGGWTVRQVVHHVADSHMNACMRFRLALTEDLPTIKPYLEAQWAELPDARSSPIETSLTLLESLHSRWLTLLQSMTEAEFDREFLHPEHGRIFNLHWALGMYAWHGRHHTAHITRLAGRMGWTNKTL